MELIENKVEWKKLKRRKSDDDVGLPARFPCWVYFTVLSFGYEEEQARYLYKDDLEKMLKAL